MRTKVKSSQESALISAKHVQKALEERIFRHNLADEQTRDLISRGIIMIDLESAVVGQVNGLSIYSLGRHHSLGNLQR